MPVTGRPGRDANRINRVALKHDWIEVADLPFDGDVPVTLPDERRVILPRNGGTEVVPLNTLTRAWWAAVSSMPHCVLWTLTDWHFALATALVADATFDGDKGAAAELRQREAIIGTTVDTRRKLLIRYVEADTIAQDEPAPIAPEGATVSNLDDRRARLTGT